ncbi:MAG: tetratricopeptide repeat protein, partial [Candidatus Aminicenantes bacterium]|nr:tetratricopeptide repeat protein [Candidatus Aminicenantes bacterium]
KRRLAELYIKEGAADEAVEMLNEAAEIKLDRQDLNEVEKILSQAGHLKRGYLRTALNSIELMKRSNRRAEAIALAEDSLRHHADNLDLLSHLGGLYLEEKLFRKAEEIFTRMYENNPNEINTLVRLGYALIQLNKLDRAYDLYEPLVNTLLSKNREDKAVGLLGLLVMGREVYLPALEKLAVIFKSRNQRENLEAVLRVLLLEYRDKDLRQKSLVVLRELIDLCPDDPVLAREFSQSGTETRAKPAAPPARAEGGTRLSAKDRETIQVNMSKAELYLQQGLVLNAKRILENLNLLYPQDKDVRLRLESLKMISGPASREAIPKIVERTSVLEQKGGRSRRAEARPMADLSSKEQVSSQDLFSGLDSLSRPMAFDESRYPDLTDRIAEELALIEAVTFQQQKKATALVENPLSEIIRDFRRDVDQKLKPSSLEVRYSLGMAFYEQELYEEAAEEFKLASEDEKRRADCYSLISLCHRARKDYVQALDWLNKALSLVKEGTRKSYVLKYELGTLFEEMEQKDKALGMFSEVRRWNPQFRNVARRIKTLKASAG